MHTRPLLGSSTHTLHLLALCIATCAACGGDPSPPALSFPSDAQADALPALSTHPVAPITSDALFVINSGTETLTVIDTARSARVSDIPLFNAHFPYALALAEGGAALWVTVPSIDLSGGFQPLGGRHGDGSPPQPALMKLDAVTGETRAVKLLSDPPTTAVVAPDGTIWTALNTSPGLVMVIDPVTLDVLASIPVGAGPVTLTLSLDGAQALVANIGDGTVSVLSTRSREVITSVSVGDTPTAAWTSDGLAFVTHEAQRSLDVIDLAALAVTHRYDLGFYPGAAAVAPSGELWITDPDAGRVVRYSLPPDAVALGDILTGPGAGALRIVPSQQRAYVANLLADSVSVIDTQTLQVLATLPVGDQPSGLAWRAAPP
jgi:YVTN family beta-propeller protein